MGLTISYTLSLKREVSPEVVRELVRRTALYARKIGCAEVSRLLRAEKVQSIAALTFSPRQCWGRYRTCAPAKRGWLVPVLPGPGCETAFFGLCQYPRRISDEWGPMWTGFRGGWQFDGSCKTQYAGAHGWENFLQCHLRVISLLDFWRRLGVRVWVSDEGGYWKTRSVEKLRAELRSYDSFVAAMSGVLKDADTGLSLRAPILDYRDFERLEHEGWQQFGGPLERLKAKVSARLRGGGAGPRTAPR